MLIEVDELNIDENKITVLEEMTIYNVLELNSNIASYFQEGKNVTLDLSNVLEADSAGIQLLIFLKQEASLLNFKLNIINITPSVLDIITLFSLTELFEINMSEGKYNE